METIEAIDVFIHISEFKVIKDLIKVKNISKSFSLKTNLIETILPNKKNNKRIIKAVNDVTFDIKYGEIVGLVGESGCGKSTLGRIICNILKPDKGEISFGENNISLNSLEIQMIFQDPFNSLNPRYRVKNIISEAALFHELVSKNEEDEFVDDLLNKCGLNKEVKNRFPHQLSGGQRKRVGIARALAVKPKLLVCDEAVAGLDVSIQAQIINLFFELQNNYNLTYFFISHDLSVVEHISDQVIIMYFGRIVEMASAEDIFKKPNHPYTKALMEQIPNINKRNLSFQPITGEMPSATKAPRGCKFHPRCRFVKSICREIEPNLIEISPGWQSACHLNYN